MQCVYHGLSTAWLSVCKDKPETSHTFNAQVSKRFEAGFPLYKNFNLMFVLLGLKCRVKTLWNIIFLQVTCQTRITVIKFYEDDVSSLLCFIRIAPKLVELLVCHLSNWRSISSWCTDNT